MKKELDGVGPGGDKERTKHCLQKIRELEPSASSTDQMTRFLYILSLLVQHKKFDVLRQSQVKNLSHVADAILKTQGMDKEKCKLSYIAGDFYLLTSQIFRKDGAHWDALWAQLLSNRYYVRNPERSDLIAISSGIRLLRLGHAVAATKQLEEALQESTSPLNHNLAKVMLVKALRVSGQFEKAEAKAKEFLSDLNGDENAELEIRWEAACLEMHEQGTIASLTTLVNPRKPHYKPSYAVESFMWTMTLHQKGEERRVPKMSYLARKKDFDVRALGAFFKAATLIEDAYDPDISITLRLKRMGEILSEAKFCTNIDQELMVYAACARWASRHKAFRHAGVILGEYVSLSQKLSKFKNPDVLGVMGDLLGKPWFSAFYEQYGNAIQIVNTVNPDDGEDDDDLEGLDSKAIKTA